MNAEVALGLKWNIAIPGNAAFVDVTAGVRIAYPLYSMLVALLYVQEPRKHRSTSWLRVRWRRRLSALRDSA